MNRYITRWAESSLQSWISSPKILLVLGARQVGKTTLLKNFFRTYKTTYLNLDLEIDKQLFLSAAPHDPASAENILGSPAILIIDEAQRLPEVSRIVKGWYDSGTNFKIILSGSSSLNLLDKSAESLTGRNIKLFLPPLVFGEIISFQPWYGPSLPLAYNTTFSNQINSLLLSSFVFGSYPETVTTSDKISYLNNLVSDYLLKDVLGLGLVKTPDFIRRLLLLLAHQLGSVVSVNELATSLGISRITINRYLYLLEETFIIFRLPAYSTNPRKEIAKSQKMYFWDTGVRNALVGEFNLNPLRSDIGQLWENWLVAEFAKANLLKANPDKLFFWRSRIGSEVDLVIKSATGELSAYEIKWSPAKPTRSFTNKYSIPVKVINKQNYLSFIPLNPFTAKR